MDWDAVKLVLGSSVLATLLALLAQTVRERWRRQEELLGARRAIQAEIDSAARHGKGYLEPGAVKLVGWRVSTLVYESVFPKLLGLSAVTHAAADALINYYQNLESFNRSLDQIADHQTNGRDELILGEVARADLKAMHVTSSQNLRAIADSGNCDAGVKADIEAKLEKVGGRTLYDKAREQLGLM